MNKPNAHLGGNIFDPPPHNRGPPYPFSPNENNQLSSASFNQQVISPGYPTHPMSAAPVMTRARSSSRSLLSGPILNASGMNQSSSAAPLTVATLPLLSPNDSSSSSTPSSAVVAADSSSDQMRYGQPNGDIAMTSISDNDGSKSTGLDNHSTDAGRLSLNVQDTNVSSVFDDSDDTRLTAIYRPESSDAWREQLRQAGEKEKLRMRSREDAELGNRSDELTGLTLGDEVREERRNSIVNGSPAAGTSQKDFEAYKVWKPKRTLRSLSALPDFF